MQRTCDDPYVEADEKNALCFLKLKVSTFHKMFCNELQSGNELIQNGYLVQIEFSDEIPGRV